MYICTHIYTHIYVNILYCSTIYTVSCFPSTLMEKLVSNLKCIKFYPVHPKAWTARAECQCCRNEIKYAGGTISALVLRKLKLFTWRVCSCGQLSGLSQKCDANLDPGRSEAESRASGIAQWEFRPRVRNKAGEKFLTCTLATNYKT